MTKKFSYRRLTKEIELVAPINGDTLSFDLYVSQWDSDNADFVAKLKEHKLRAKSRTKNRSNYYNLQNIMINLQLKDELIDTFKILMVGTKYRKQRKIIKSTSKDKREKGFRVFQSKGGSMILWITPRCFCICLNTFLYMDTMSTVLC